MRLSVLLPIAAALTVVAIGSSDEASARSREPAVRDHRTPAPTVRDHRAPKVYPVRPTGKTVVRPGRNYDKTPTREQVIVNGKRVPRNVDGGPVIRDHRKPAPAPVVNDHRKPASAPVVRDHRKPAPAPVVRDHRKPAPAPVVNDHRKPAPAPVVRDHRKPAPAPVVNDHRKPASAPVVNDHRRPRPQGGVTVTPGPARN